jgi:hypothetical protein
LLSVLANDGSPAGDGGQPCKLCRVRTNLHSHVVVLSRLNDCLEKCPSL